MHSLFDVEYTCVVERMVYVSDSTEARMNFTGINSSAKIGQFFFWENPF